MPNIDIEDNIEHKRWTTLTNTMNGKGGNSAKMTNPNRREC